MAELDIRVLTADTSQPLTFAKISEFDAIDTVSATDYVLLSGYRNGEEITQRVSVYDIATYFNQEIVTHEVRWFIPVLNTNTSTIHWEMHRVSETGEVENDPNAPNKVMPINLVDAIGDVTDTKSGLLPPAYKAKLDSLDPVTHEKDGFMTKEDKIKLDTVDTNANYYVLPTASTNTLGGVKVDGTTITIENGVIKANAGAPTAKHCTISISDWSPSHTAKVNLNLDTTKRNMIDVIPSSMDQWVDCKVRAISEDSTGITFACDNYPSSNLEFYVISMMVIYET